MPLEAPVTSAIWPASFWDMTFLLSLKFLLLWDETEGRKDSIVKTDYPAPKGEFGK